MKYSDVVFINEYEFIGEDERFQASSYFNNWMSDTGTLSQVKRDAVRHAELVAKLLGEPVEGAYTDILGCEHFGIEIRVCKND